jgi:hypothetical protein
VLVVLAADLYVGYAALRNRARRMPGLVREREWDLQHERGARRLLDAVTAMGGTLITLRRALTSLAGITQRLDPDLDALSIVARYA